MVEACCKQNDTTVCSQQDADKNSDVVYEESKKVERLTYQ
jgi:hypothetical protein